MPPRREVVAADVQRAGSFEGLQELFGCLGYDVRNPVDLTAASLGIAERFQAEVVGVRRLASQAIVPGGPAGFEVYAFETTTQTAELRKALAAAFRLKPVKVLFVVARRDFDPLDFVLVEQAPGASGGPVSHVRVSYQLFSVDRRRPSSVHLRVLNRMQATAGDAFAQYERVSDAFAFAAWSSDEFNNRNLFSDYFLTRRLRFVPPFQGLFEADEREPQRAAERLVRDFDPDSRASGGTTYQAGFLQPLLTVLGFKTAADREGEADFLLHAADSRDASPLALLATSRCNTSSSTSSSTRSPAGVLRARVVAEQHIVKYIVEHTVGPLLEAKFATIRTGSEGPGLFDQ